MTKCGWTARVPEVDISSCVDKQEAYSRIESAFDCEHDRRQLTKRTLRNGATSFVKQCCDCGAAEGTPVAKRLLAHVDVKLLPEFDDGIRERWKRAKDAYYARAQALFSERWHREYDSYLDSDAWRRKRKLVLRRSGGMCEGCGAAKATQVHHLSYEHVGRELLFELVAVCDACHATAHDKEEAA